MMYMKCLQHSKVMDKQSRLNSIRGNSMGRGAAAWNNGERVKPSSSSRLTPNPNSPRLLFFLTRWVMGKTVLP